MGRSSELLFGDLPGNFDLQAGSGFSVTALALSHLPANPDTARSYEGDVLLDEYGFHQDARKIYEAVSPPLRAVSVFDYQHAERSAGNLLRPGE